MANWMHCDYHNASLNHSAPNKGLPINEPVNLDLCKTISRDDIYRQGGYELVFHFDNSEPLTWKFINVPLRNLEYDRAISLMKN